MTTEIIEMPTKRLIRVNMLNMFTWVAERIVDLSPSDDEAMLRVVQYVVQKWYGMTESIGQQAVGMSEDQNDKRDGSHLEDIHPFIALTRPPSQGALLGVLHSHKEQICSTEPINR